MPTPAVYRAGGLDPFHEVRPEDRTTQVPIYYITDREPSGNSSIGDYYSGSRSKDLRVGQATVQLGSPDQTWEDLCRESQLEKRGKNPKVAVADLSEYGVLWTREFPTDLKRPVELPSSAETSQSGDRFLREINNRLALFPEKNIYLFVHGYNSSLTSSVSIGAQLWHYLGRDGVFISYSWPSRDRVAFYTVDKGNSVYSVRNFRLLLKYLAERTEVDQIHIIAHSAGTVVPLAAFSQMSLMNYDRPAEEIWREKKIGNVVLAAPDVDVELFINAGLDGSNRVPRRMTLYASREDRALSLSGRLLSMARLGNPFKMISTEELGALRRAEGRALVDVSPSQKRYREFLDHSYFHKNPWVSSDLLMFIKYGLPPEDRGLVPFEEGALWTFSEDYPERIKNIRIAPPEKGLSEPVLRPAEPLLPVDPGEPLGEIQIEGL